MNVDGGTVDDGPWAEVAAAAAEIEPLEGKGPSQKPSAALRTLQTLQKWRWLASWKARPMSMLMSARTQVRTWQATSTATLLNSVCGCVWNAASTIGRTRRRSAPGVTWQRRRRGMVDLVLKRGPCADYPWSYCLMYSVTHETLLRLHRKGVSPALETHRSPTLQLRPHGGLGNPNLGHVTHINCLHGCVAYADCLQNDLVGKCPGLCSERDPKWWSRA